jgi:hypothetical protein
MSSNLSSLQANIIGVGMSGKEPGTCCTDAVRCGVQSSSSLFIPYRNQVYAGTSTNAGHATYADKMAEFEEK